MDLLTPSSRSRLLAFSHPKRRFQSTQTRLLLKRAVETELFSLLGINSRANNAPVQCFFEERCPDSPLVHLEGITPSCWTSSLSHTEGAIACALSPMPWANLVDIEVIRTDKSLAHYRKLMESVFETPFIDAFDRTIATLSESSAYARFFRYWGAYECRVKANTRCSPEHPNSPRKRFLLSLVDDEPLLVDTDYQLAYSIGFTQVQRRQNLSMNEKNTQLAISYVALNTSTNLEKSTLSSSPKPLEVLISSKPLDVELVELPLNPPCWLDIHS